MDINATDNEDKTILHRAANTGDLETIKLLLKHKAKVNLRDKDDYTPLMYAAEKGHIGIIKILIKHGADIDCEGASIPPIVLAAKNEHFEAVKFLVKNGANVNATDNYGEGRQSALHHAAYAGDLETIEFLVKHKAEVNLRDAEDFTPLILAEESSNEEAIKYLVEHGAEVDIMGEDGEPFIDSSREEPRLNAERIRLYEQTLIKKHPDFGSFRDSLLNAKAEHGHDYENLLNIVSKLIEKNKKKKLSEKLKLRSGNSNGETLGALIVRWVFEAFETEEAAAKGVEILNKINEYCDEYFINYSDFPQNNNKDTFLHIAASIHDGTIGNNEPIQALFDADTFFSTENCHQQTPFHIACSCGAVELVLAFLREKEVIEEEFEDRERDISDISLYSVFANRWTYCLNQSSQRSDWRKVINKQDAKGNTALHLAVKNEKYEDSVEDVVKILIAAGADFTIENKKGFTPLEIAMYFSNKRCQRIFTETETFEEILNELEDVNRDYEDLEDFSSQNELEELREFLSRHDDTESDREPESEVESSAESDTESSTDSDGKDVGSNRNTLFHSNSKKHNSHGKNNKLPAKKK